MMNKPQNPTYMKRSAFLVVVFGLFGTVSLQAQELIPYRKGDKMGFCTPDKKVVIQPKYHWANPFSEGLAEVKLNGKWGFIDKTGREVVPLKYDGAGEFSEGLARVKLNGKYGFIDKTGREVVPPKYVLVLGFGEGLAGVMLNGNTFYIKVFPDGKVVEYYDE